MATGVGRRLLRFVRKLPDIRRWTFRGWEDAAGVGGSVCDTTAAHRAVDGAQPLSRGFSKAVRCSTSLAI